MRVCVHAPGVSTRRPAAARVPRRRVPAEAQAPAVAVATVVGGRALARLADFCSIPNHGQNPPSNESLICGEKHPNKRVRFAYKNLKL